LKKIKIVSSCLAGIKCRYDGRDNIIPAIHKMVEQGEVITVCPEVLGGLTTPRIPAEIVVSQNGERRVINRDGKDVTAEFEAGAQKTLEIAQAAGAEIAIMKQRSPSCGCGQTYDGTFSGVIINADGITSALLKKNGITVLTEEDFTV